MTFDELSALLVGSTAHVILGEERADGSRIVKFMAIDATDETKTRNNEEQFLDSILSDDRIIEVFGDQRATPTAKQELRDVCKWCKWTTVDQAVTQLIEGDRQRKHKR